MGKTPKVKIIKGDLPNDSESICMRMFGMNMDSFVEAIRANKDGKYNAFHGLDSKDEARRHSEQGAASG